MKQNLEKAILIAVIILGLALSMSCGSQSGSGDFYGSAALTNSKETSRKLAESNILTKSWTAIPVPMYISESVPEEFRDAMIDAMDMWNEAAGIELFSYTGVIPDTERAKDHVNAIYWNEENSANNYFGETFYSWVNDTVLIESDVVFYGDPDEFAILECEDGGDICRSANRKKDVMTTAIHELGHVLGLEHINDRNHIMNPSFTYGDVHHRFEEGLVSEIIDIYDPIFFAVNAE